MRRYKLRRKARRERQAKRLPWKRSEHDKVLAMLDRSESGKEWVVVDIHHERK